MNNSEEQEMLELCEADSDDLKPVEEVKFTEVIPRDDAVVVEECQMKEEPKGEVPADITTQEKNDLYHSLELDLKDPRVVTYMRLDTLHIQGVNEMSTKDVYDFFHPLKPMTLEWINDSSCNVVWSDENLSAQALLQVTVPLEDQTQLLTVRKPKSRELTDVIGEKEDVKEGNQIVIVEDDDEEGSEDGEISDPVSKVVWRTVVGTSLKLRFATWDDRKVRGAEKFSQYYKKYGNPNFGGLKGLISKSRKRRFREEPAEEKTSERDSMEGENEQDEKEVPLEDARLRITKNAAEKSERKEGIKRPKMKMYADEEEEKKIRRPKSNNVSNRLGSITVNVLMREEEEEYDDVDEKQSVDYDDLEVSSLREFGSRSVWDRLQVEVSNTKHYEKEERRRPRNRESGDREPDLRRKLQRIRDDRKKDHRSPLLVGEYP